MADFVMDIDDGIATITWDVPGKSMNVLTFDGLATLEQLIDRALGAAEVRGIVLTSGKRDFAGGMDLNTLARMRADAGADAGADPARGIFEGLMRIHALLRRIERAGMDPERMTGAKPVVAALPGTTAGIGLELALSCHRIIAADRPDARIGLPEIKLGIFPGAGGTTRLVRKLGAMAAAPFLLEGRMLAPAAMLRAGVIDDVVAPEDLLSRARAWIAGAADADLVKPWDTRGYKMPGGAPYHPAGFLTFVGANAMVLGRTAGVYPAAKALLSAVYEGAQVPFDTALRIEARWFTHVMMQPQAEAMIRTLFVNKQALERGAHRPDLPESPVRRLGVIGAGMMGAGIAQAAAQAGIPVVLLEPDQAGADRAVAGIATALDVARKRGRITAEAAEAARARITASGDMAALSGCDLVIEAVYEDAGIKADVIRNALPHLSETCIFATNTSTIPVSELARNSTAPANFIGLHFFSPVDRMALVEVIRGDTTGPQAVARALDFVRALRKTPIVVNDARFFYANRCIIPYVNEGLRMLAEGVRPALIENAARGLGMPLGPLQLIDETSLDLGVKIARATRAALGDAYAQSDADAVIFAMVDQGRTGRKTGAGFYDYAQGDRTGLWPGLADIWPPASAQPGVAAVQDRLLMVQVLEAVRALEAGVLTDVRDGDVGAILGWGFAPWSGGPFSWLDTLGADAALARAEALAARHGPRFAPPALLRAVMARGGRFHDGPHPAGTGAQT
jgi:3-hydroxyacyl-CoA dehydrogenase/enoyl-CoA hydratase/3-hydroxybutyryl-CoA epimerase